MSLYNKNVFEKIEGATYTATVVAYMRYSSENQDIHSIESQRIAIKKYCDEQHYYLCAEYWDEALTGTNDRRPSFQKLIADSEDNAPWELILVFDYSRFFRNTNDATMYSMRLWNVGIDIFSVTERYDMSSEGLLMRDIKHGYNSFTSRNIGKFTYQGLLTNAINAEHCGGVPPLGYDIVEKKLVINEYEAAIVKQIFDMYENNFSYSQIAKELNSKGYRTKQGNLFTKNSFDSILHQEKYKGTFTWNKTRPKSYDGKRNSHKLKKEAEQVCKPDMVPPIISAEQYDRVQLLFTNRKNGTASSKNRHFYLLSGGGFLRCTECGALMIGSIVRSHGSSYKYYYCPNHKKRAEDGKLRCSNVGINAEPLDNFIIWTLVKDIYKRSDLISIYNTAEDTNIVRYLTYQLQGIEKSSRNLVKKIAKTDNSDVSDALLLELTDLSKRKAAIKEEIDRLQANMVIYTEADRKKLCKKIKKLMETGDSLAVKKYLKEIIDEIKVGNNNIDITLNIA